MTGTTARDLLILGTGPHAAEMADIVARVNARSRTWNLLGFLSHGEEPASGCLDGLPVLRAADAAADYPDAVLVPTHDWPDQPPLPRQRLASLIDPSAFVSRGAKVGAGVVIYPNCFVGANVRIGDRVFCLSGSVINHDDVIGERAVIASGVILAGEVVVEADCYLGQSCSIRQRLRVGRASFIGMGAVVLEDVPPNSVMIGNPAKRLRDRF